MRSILVSIGSNQKDPSQQVMEAFESLERCFGAVTKSSLYETAPVGMESDSTFINAAAIIQTDLTADVLLDQLLKIERDSGRIREKGKGYQSRPLDLDIILSGDEVQDDKVQIPHPRFRERRFVLEPSAEIAAEMVDPITGQSIEELLNSCRDENWVRKLEEELEVL